MLIALQRKPLTPGEVAAQPTERGYPRPAMRLLPTHRTGVILRFSQRKPKNLANGNTAVCAVCSHRTFLRGNVTFALTRVWRVHSAPSTFCARRDSSSAFVGLLGMTLMRLLALNTHPLASLVEGGVAEPARGRREFSPTTGAPPLRVPSARHTVAATRLDRTSL